MDQSRRSGGHRWASGDAGEEGSWEKRSAAVLSVSGGICPGMSLDRARPWLCSAFLGPGCCGRSSACKQNQAREHGGGDARRHPPGRSVLCRKISRLLSCSPNFGSSFLILETPLSLSQLCRVTVRKAAGQRALEKIAKLNIPPRLIQYLSYN